MFNRMSMLNFKNHRLLEEIRDNTSKTVLEHNGELQVIAQDELLLIKNELADIKQTLADGTQKVQVSGNIVDLLPRAVRTVSTGYANTAKPRWAKGFILSVMVYGLTGQFTGETDGISLEIGLRGHNSASTELALASTAKYKNIAVLGAVVYPGAIINDDKWIRSGQRIVAGIPSGSNVYYRLNISGIFNAGQGIDCDAKIEWLP